MWNSTFDKYKCIIKCFLELYNSLFVMFPTGIGKQYFI